MLWLIAGVTLGLALFMAIGWAVQRHLGNGGWTDVFWTFGLGIAGVAYALWPLGDDTITTRQWVVAALVAAWALRLGGYLAIRVRSTAEDVRYAFLRHEWGERYHPLMFGFLQVQALAGAILAVSVLAAAHNPAPFPTLTDILGILIYGAALVGEGLADQQLRTFKQRGERGVCMDGLWGWSRHPNYFFEWLGWCAWPLMAVNLSGDYAFGWLAFIGPVAMYALLVYFSGIPPLEQRMLESRGQAYRAYQDRTSPFFPRPPRREG